MFFDFWELNSAVIKPEIPSRTVYYICQHNQYNKIKFFQENVHRKHICIFLCSDSTQRSCSPLCSVTNPETSRINHLCLEKVSREKSCFSMLEKKEHASTADTFQCAKVGCVYGRVRRSQNLSAELLESCLLESQESAA